jgi:hypothetical protein
MVGQHAWSGVVAGTTRDSFLVSGNYPAFLQTSGFLVPGLSVFFGEEGPALGGFSLAAFAVRRSNGRPVQKGVRAWRQVR